MEQRPVRRPEELREARKRAVRVQEERLRAVHPAAGAPGLGITGEFIMSIVPLNFGAAAPFRLNPHFLQVVAASSFSVPQFGQNTQHLF